MTKHVCILCCQNKYSSLQRHRIALDTTLDDVREKEACTMNTMSLKPDFKVVEVVDLDSSVAALLGRLATKTE